MYTTFIEVMNHILFGHVFETLKSIVLCQGEKQKYAHTRK